ncbi:MAG: chloramphenicol acetyltransferase [Silicimonas sp.]|nr:chloramphenicol acetyltransferase [Silicimonas sp.]
MTGTPVDLDAWPRAEQFRFFRTFDRPHYATTVRVDVSCLMAARKVQNLSPFRHALYAIGAGLHTVPELRMRFRGDVVTRYDRLMLSPTIPLDNGDFRYTYLSFNPDRAAFDAHTQAKIEEVRAGAPLNANDGTIQDVAYLSCLPWLDYTSLDNALPGPDDCIPRVSWGKIVPKGDGFDMAMTIQVHHALVDGLQVGQFFEATQNALNDM